MTVFEMGDVEVQMQVSTSATEKKTKKVKKTTTKKSSKHVDGGVEITEQTTTIEEVEGKENLPLEGETYRHTHIYLSSQFS